MCGLALAGLSCRRAAAGEVVYSKEAQAVLDQAARIAQASNSAAVRIEDVLVSFSALPCRVMAELKERQRFTAVQWRTAVAGFANSGARTSAGRPPVGFDYVTPEQAAELLHVHVQTIRDYIRSGRLRAFRLAGERAIRIRRADLESLFEPLVPGNV